MPMLCLREEEVQELAMLRILVPLAVALSIPRMPFVAPPAAFREQATVVPAEVASHTSPFLVLFLEAKLMDSIRYGYSPFDHDSASSHSL